MMLAADTVVAGLHRSSPAIYVVAMGAGGTATAWMRVSSPRMTTSIGIF
jgi:hypothetical protein